MKAAFRLLSTAFDMQIVHTIVELNKELTKAGRVVFAPTMGNLHEVHLDLIRVGRTYGDTVVSSVFVNPLQFGQGEDFERYPRTLAEDTKKLATAGCDVLFAPDVSEIYPEMQTFHVMPSLADQLCGAFRPGHFSGVCTVVLKLFDIVRPDIAVFGKKDYQQLYLIKGMVRQFNMPITIVGVETRRADDGLALSSRNGYLSAEDRDKAPMLFRELNHISRAMSNGNRDFRALEALTGDQLTREGWKVDYISIRSQSTLLAPVEAEAKLVVLAAAWLNRTRLIDNIEVDIIEGTIVGL